MGEGRTQRNFYKRKQSFNKCTNSLTGGVGSGVGLQINAFLREIRCIVDIFWNTSMVNGAVSKKILTRKFPSSKALYWRTAQYLSLTI